MKRQFSRLSLLVIVTVALIGSMTMPAEATMVGGGLLQGRASVGNGLASPCLDGKGPSPSVNPAKCPAFLNGKAPVSFTFSGTLTGAIAKVNKTKCKTAKPNACYDIGTFPVAASGSVVGKCGASLGNGSGAIGTGASNVRTKPATNATRSFTFSWTGVGGNLILSGTIDGTGTLAGVVAAAPDVFTGGSCTHKAAKDFIVVGPVVMINRCGNAPIPGC